MTCKQLNAEQVHAVGAAALENALDVMSWPGSGSRPQAGRYRIRFLMFDRLPAWPEGLSPEDRATAETRILFLLHGHPWMPEQDIRGSLWNEVEFLPALKDNRLLTSRRRKYGHTEFQRRQVPGLPYKTHRLDEFALSDRGEVVVGWLHGLANPAYPLPGEREILVSCVPYSVEGGGGKELEGFERVFPWGRGPDSHSMDIQGEYERLFRLGLLTWTVTHGPALTELGSKESRKFQSQDAQRRF